ncbi:GAF domain-containing protein [Micromonospora sp. NPDC051300]|uniref:GAF domain-containing protein n=1 Tax=Micromonospora sp. NPDC051300 TaxID=3364286 RepID=UPI0037B03441
MTDEMRLRQIVAAMYRLNGGDAEHERVRRDPDRLDVLRRHGVLDKPADGTFDDIAALAVSVCGTAMSTVSIVDADRVWFAASRGLDGVSEVGVDPGLCASAFCAHGPYMIEDLQVEPRTLSHPLVRGGLGLRFYAAAPIITRDGHRLGVVTALDVITQKLTPDQRASLVRLAGLVARQLDLRLDALRAVRAERWAGRNPDRGSP